MSKLYIKEKLFSFGGHFAVTDEYGNKKYTVEGSVMSIPKMFTISDRYGKTIGTITKKTFSWLPTFFIQSGVEEVIISQQLTFFKAKYQIEAKGLVINGDWWDKNFTIERNGKTVARIEKEWFTWSDQFEIAIYDEDLEKIIVSLVIAIDYVTHQSHNN